MLNLYNIEGDANDLPGELDFNFLIKTPSGNYILKIRRPGIFRVSTRNPSTCFKKQCEFS